MKYAFLCSYFSLHSHEKKPLSRLLPFPVTTPYGLRLSLAVVGLSLTKTHIHTHTCTVHEIIATYTARCRSFSSLSPLPPVLLGFPAEQSSVSSTAGLELQGHTGKLKPPACLQSTSFFRWATFYPDLQDAQRGIGHSSQRAKN